MLVPAARHEEALAIAKKAAEAHKVGDPRSEDTQLGPLVSQVQFDKVQRLIEAGIAEGATLVTGGPGRPEHLNRGYYARPTIFGHVKPGMTGWAQVNGLRGETDTFEKMQRRIEHDLYYVDNWSFFFDLKILVRTAFSKRARINAY